MRSEVQLPQFRTITPPSLTPVDYSRAKQHLRIDDDDERSYIVTLIEAATANAETIMTRALVNRAVEVVYPSWNSGMPSNGPRCDESRRLYRLPLGPVGLISDVTAVTDGDGIGRIDNCTLLRRGNSWMIGVPSEATYPLTVQYNAGHGTPADVPADIKAAILSHVGTLYRHREVATEKTQNRIPYGVQVIYQNHATTPPLT